MIVSLLNLTQLSRTHVLGVTQGLYVDGQQYVRPLVVAHRRYEAPPACLLPHAPHALQKQNQLSYLLEVWGERHR